LVFLIILIVAAAGLVAWLLARVGAGDLRLPRLRESSLEGASPSGSAVPTVRGGAGGHGSIESDADQRQVDQGHRRQQSPDDESSDYDSDVEQAVRARLYGPYGRRD
jgi:hypothetical protein